MIFMPMAVVKGNVANAQTINSKTNEQIAQEIKAELASFVESGTVQNEKIRDYRVPGSKEEFEASKYILNEMNTLSHFTPVNDGATVNGVQNFNFKSVVDGLNYTSQNIVFRRESGSGSSKKVILAAHYDSSFVYEQKKNNETGEYENVSVVSDGVNDNAGSVALLLTIAKNLDAVSTDTGFDVEIVFFGASANDYAGSKFYNKGKSNEDCKNVLLMINFLLENIHTFMLMSLKQRKKNI